MFFKENRKIKNQPEGMKKEMIFKMKQETKNKAEEGDSRSCVLTFLAFIIELKRIINENLQPKITEGGDGYKKIVSWNKDNGSDGFQIFKTGSKGRGVKMLLCCWYFDNIGATNGVSRSTSSNYHSSCGLPKGTEVVQEVVYQNRGKKLNSYRIIYDIPGNSNYESNGKSLILQLITFAFYLIDQKKFKRCQFSFEWSFLCKIFGEDKESIFTMLAVTSEIARNGSMWCKFKLSGMETCAEDKQKIEKINNRSYWNENVRERWDTMKSETVFTNPTC